LEVFLAEVKDYAHKAYAGCSKLCPGLNTNEFIKEWWENPQFSDSNFEPKVTHRDALSPSHPLNRKR
jgi:hypothetical protein